MKVLIVGKGGREHAMLKACKKSNLVEKIYVLPGNCKMEDATRVDIDMYDIEEVKNFAIKENIDLTLVGPSDVLALGIKDEFDKVGLNIFAPTKSATRIESSRYFTKQLMEKLKIPTTKYVVFTDREQALKFVSGIEKFPVTIKIDSLSKNLGIFIARSNKMANDIVNEIFDENENSKILVEEFVMGKEFSIFALVKNEKIYPLQIVKDYKRTSDSEDGEHTGGMGACSPVAKVTDNEIEQVVEKILKPMAKSMYEDGYGFEGFLYGEIVIAQDGIKVLSFNARLGDPEAEVLLPRLKSDFVQNILDVMNDKEPEIVWSDDVCVGIVLASNGYPSKEKCQDKMNLVPVDNDICFMGIEEKEGEVFAKGGRNLIVTAMAKDFETARELAYKDIEKLKTDSFFYREDIGKF